MQTDVNKHLLVFLFFFLSFFEFSLSENVRLQALSPARISPAAQLSSRPQTHQRGRARAIGRDAGHHPRLLELSPGRPQPRDGSVRFVAGAHARAGELPWHGVSRDLSRRLESFSSCCECRMRYRRWKLHWTRAPLRSRPRSRWNRRMFPRCLRMTVPTARTLPKRSRLGRRGMSPAFAAM